MNKIVLSLGGSLLFEPDGLSPSSILISSYANWLKYFSKSYQTIAVVGGGLTARSYIKAAIGANDTLTSDQLDELGIDVSKLNAKLLQFVCGDQVSKKIIFDPRTKITTKSKIVIGAGWKPGRSTDYDAVMLAVHNNVDTVYNLSNIRYLYDKDPKKHKTAKQIYDITWRGLFGIIGSQWSPGLNMPFDPIAAKLAYRNQITVKLLSGNDRNNLEKAIKGNGFTGTTIHP